MHGLSIRGDPELHPKLRLFWSHFTDHPGGAGGGHSVASVVAPQHGVAWVPQRGGWKGALMGVRVSVIQIGDMGSVGLDVGLSVGPTERVEGCRSGGE